ncbi:hypothetical protein GALMADRAFT_253618, partial [Galerina marginata CBS 339.88]
MDTGEYQSICHYEQPFVRPEYPTPPSSFSHADGRESYANSYVYATTPNVPAQNYESYLQTPTPNDSLTSSPLVTELALSAETLSIDKDDTVAISTVFHPGADPVPDTLFLSADGVVFYVHAQTILNSCLTSFEPCLPVPLSDQQCRNKIIQLDASSVELNVIMHTLYGTSPAAHSPDIETLVRAVDRMPTYGLPPKSLIRPSTPLYDLLLAHGPLRPLEVYAVAAFHGLTPLATTVSSHLLSYDLSSISDEMAERIGAVYLKKLLLLHVGRFASLKRILLAPPHPHPPTKRCGFDDQKKLTRAWALVSAYLAWDARPDVSSRTMQNALNPLVEHLKCEMCHQALRDRIKDVLAQWASVKCTI